MADADVEPDRIGEALQFVAPEPVRGLLDPPESAVIVSVWAVG